MEKLSLETEALQLGLLKLGLCPQSQGLPAPCQRSFRWRCQGRANLALRMSPARAKELKRVAKRG